VFHLRGCEPGAPQPIIVGVGQKTVTPRRKESEKMIILGTAQREFGPIEDALGAFAPIGGRGLVASLATQEAMTALVREQENAAIEAEDILSQADEALVMG
jgi:hypothetical protein